jgi:hypothetical protein
MRFTALRGTLIAAAPTRDGLVPAADSRSTIGDRHCEELTKRKGRTSAREGARDQRLRLDRASGLVSK